MAMTLYRAKIKTRAQIHADIPRQLHGWWRDVCAGQTLILRDATQADLDRCYLPADSNLTPDDYLCENFEGGCLVLRSAVASMTRIPAPIGVAT